MHVVGLLIALATVLQVKDTGKSRERVKPVELLSQSKYVSAQTFEFSTCLSRYEITILLLYSILLGTF